MSEIHFFLQLNSKLNLSAMQERWAANEEEKV